MEKVSIIIPAHNEERRIGKTLERYLEYFKDLKKKHLLDFEIIVVLNACKDKTLEIVKKYKCNELSILNFEQSGKGFAVIEGFKEALKGNSSLIGFVDADMATSPESFYDLIKNIGNNHGIIASRYVPNAVIKKKQPISRIIVSRGGNFIIRSLFLLPYKDTQCGAKILRKNSLKLILPQINDSEWAFDVNLLYLMKKNKLKIKEHPTIWEEPGQSTLNLKKASIRVLFSVINLRIINSPFKRYKKLIRPITKSLYDSFK